MSDIKTNFIWLDLEMTGLNVEKDKIIEIAVMITDKSLNIISEGLSIVIKQNKCLLDEMDEWNNYHHKKSGLYKKVIQSTVSCSDAEISILNFLNKYTEKGISPICGNSVYQDRIFLKKYMPDLESFFHYRNIDVSTIKELAKNWRPEIYDQVKKNSKHVALSDIKESIDELVLYKQTLFDDKLQHEN